MHKISFLALLGGFLLSLSAFAVDPGTLEKDLNGPGLTGWIHGAVNAQGLYVFTYRNPQNFFDFYEFSLVADDPVIMQKLATFGRHDKVLVKGSYLNIPAPQKHIHIAAIDLVEKYQDPYANGDYQYQAQIPGDLTKASSALFLVHAVAGDGQIVVLEYKDAVVPMFVQNGQLTKDLYRGDLVQIAYKIQRNPDSPAHLNVDETAATPVKVIESIKAINGKPAALEGDLVLFPQSPEIMFNVFAVQQKLPAGLVRQFTLLNMDNPDIFTKIRVKLQAAWDKFPGKYVNGRNKFVSTRIRVKATGIYSEVDPSQANPQILLKSADDVVVLEN